MVCRLFGTLTHPPQNSVLPSNPSTKILELATNEPLFPVGEFGLTDDEIDKEHHNLINQVLGTDGQTETLTKYLTDKLPSNFVAKDIQHFASFLSSMLQNNNPQSRIPTTELLNHPFLTSEPGSRGWLDPRLCL